MKKALIALGILLVIIGVVMVAIAGGEEGFSSLISAYASSHDLSLATEGKEYSAEEANLLQTISVNAQNFSVYIRKSNAGELSVKHPELKGGDVITCSSKIGSTGILSVTQDNDRPFNWGVNNSKSFMVITVPASNTQLKLELKCSVGAVDILDMEFNYARFSGNTGSLNLKDCNAEKSIEANNRTGAIALNNCKSRKVDIKSNTGAISLNDLTCEELIVETKTGVISAKSTGVTGGVSAVSNTGLITFEGSAGDIYLETDTGAINFDVTSDTIKVETDTGAINGKIHGVKSEYDISVKKSVGSCNLNNQTVNKGKSLAVKVDTGSIDIDFVK